MKAFPELKELGIGHIPLEWGLPKLVEAKFPKLEVLDLGEKFIGEAGALALAEAIAKGHFDALKSLVLARNPIPEEATVKIVQAISSSNSRLRLLALGAKRNEIGPKLGSEFCKALGKYFASPAASELGEIALPQTGLGDAEAKLLAKAITPDVLPKWYFLELGKNEIGEEGKSALYEAATKWKLKNGGREIKALVSGLD